MKNDFMNRSNLSRRKFIQNCALGTAAIASGSLLGGFTRKSTINSQTGPASFGYSMDQNWLFGGKFNVDALRPLFNDKNFSRITLPHCVSKLSWQNWNQEDWEKVWIYRRHFNLPESCKGQRIFLSFDGVMVGTKPVINGHELPEHLGGYLPSNYEITNYIADDDNVLAVAVDSRWSNVPPEGSPEGPKRIDYLEPGGIFRSVHLKVLPQIFISNVFAKPVKVLDPDRQIKVTCSVDTTKTVSGPVVIQVELRERTKLISSSKKTIHIEKPGQTETEITLSDLGNIKLWDVDAPNLYDLIVRLFVNDKPVHDYHVHIGLREAKFELDGFFLNGHRLQLFGLNRHELYPYVGFAMPQRVICRDAEILKNEFNCNVVRCSHYPQSNAFLDACDELGIMVWEEVPGWSYIGNDAWKEFVVRDVKDMIIRDRNHPSIIIWGTRVNESPNEVELYRKTREIAKSLDDSRPSSGSMTGGSRKNWEKDWHEDVFAYDDYGVDQDGSVGIREPVSGVPYMLAEAVGQFNYSSPKEGFNAKYRRAGDVKIQMQQALNHAQAHNKAAADPRNCGVIAWCGFDYASLINPYNNVKCPGVADVFRIPKLGASFYQAQVNPKSRIVIQPNFYWDFANETPGKNASIFSNCERLELYIDEKIYKSLLPDSTNFPHIKYPPFFVDLDIDGSKHPELRIDGYIKDKLLLSKSYSSDSSNDKFFLKADELELFGNGSDASRVEFKVVDKFNESSLNASGKVTFTLKGPGEIVGDNPFFLKDSGGVGSIWVKTLPGSSGEISIEAAHSSLGTKSVVINIQPENITGTI